MNTESEMARSVRDYAKAESSAIGITLGRRMPIKRRYRNCTFWNCSSQYIPFPPQFPLLSLDPTVAGKRARLYMRPRRGRMMVRRGWGKGRGIERMSLRCFRIPASIPCHCTITSFRPPPAGCDKSALVAFAAEYPEIKDYARRSFIRERLHTEF